MPFLLLLLLSADAPLSPTEAPKRMTFPPGFKVTLFAGEPDVVQPIATAFDDRGRLWVAECLSYPNWVTDPRQGRDRIIIFEDQNGDGKYSRKTVFATNIQNISGLELGHGGVWVCASPNLLFIPIDASGDKPAGPPRVVLDGWDVDKAQHNVFNRCVFGPDGWLYGCNGIKAESLVGKPGTPAAQRTPINCGVWRYHPTRQVFEVVAHGTTNPWGLDWDDYGEMFITNCVIDHLFHVTPGAHFKRMYGSDFDNHAYGLMQGCADHLHWAGGAWQDSRSGAAHADAGGGHAHAGCMVYLGDNWPDEYRNSVFMCNIHGNRLNRDLLEQKGSTYVARHGKDFLFANDSWFRGLNLVYGPDGGVFLQDWTDTGECHNYKEVDRTNGRLYKIVYGDQPKSINIDIAKLSDDELVKLQLHKNDWYVRRARLQFAERAANGKLSPSVRVALREIFKLNQDVIRRLRALWALCVIGDRTAIVAAARDNDPRVKAWALRLMADDPKLDKTLARWLKDALRDKSPVVRLAVASLAQRIPGAERKEIIHSLVYYPDDPADPNLPLMIWFAASPYIASAPVADVQPLLSSMKSPLLREYTARLVAERSVDDGVALLNPLIDRTKFEPPANDAIADVLRGLEVAWKDRQFTVPPSGWSDLAKKLSYDPPFNENREIRLRMQLLSVGFRDAQAQRGAQIAAIDSYKPISERRELLAALIKSRPPKLADDLLYDALDPVVGDLAIRGLAALNDPRVPTTLLDKYRTFTFFGQSYPAQKREALAALSSRPEWAKALLMAVKEAKVPKHDIDSATVRQLLTLRDKAVQADVEALWGRVRATAEDKKQLMSQYRAELAPGALKRANLYNGRAVFAKTCGQCHTLFEGISRLGPELTGSQRANLDYVLENVLDPSAVVAREYQMTIIQTTDGRTLTGVAAEETDAGLTLKTQTGDLRLRKSEIEKRTLTTNSVMPEGLLQSLSPADRRDLVAYLASPKQVPLPATK